MTEQQSGFAPVGGLQMYYEVHGEGFPTILLHGGIGASEMFAANLEAFAECRQVIAAHMQGHGKTPDIERPFCYETFATDIEALASHLGHEQVDLVGYSFGGGIALRVAIQYPQLVRKLVVIGMPARKVAWFPDVVTQLDGLEAAAGQIGPMVQQSPLGAMYPGVDFVELFRKTGQLEKQTYDWGTEVARIASPTMLVAADADGFDIGHYIDVYKALGGNLRDAGMDNAGRVAHRLAIVPGANHYDIFEHGTVVADLVIPFLDA